MQTIRIKKINEILLITLCPVYCLTCGLSVSEAKSNMRTLRSLEPVAI